MKKLLTVILAAVMAVLMATVLPLQTFAAGEQAGKYISALSIAYGRDEMANNGFTIIDSDLNSGTEKGDVFLGYKTTNDPMLGITDIKAIQEKNGYTIFDAEDIMENLNGEALEDAIYLMRVITEFRENYNNKQEFAVYAFNWLQKYNYSENLRLGTFLTDPALTANGLTDIVLNAAPEVLNNVYIFLCIGLIKDDNSTFLTRLKDVDEADYEEDNIIKGKARELLNLIKSYQLYISNNINAIESGDDNADKSIYMCSDMLSLYKVGEMNLFEYLMRANLKASDLYPLVSLLTDNELYMAKFLGFEQFILAEAWGFSETEKLGKLEDYAGGESFDFWEGSTKRLGGRIAVTNELMQQMILGNTQSLTEVLMSNKNIAAVASAGVSLAVFCGGLATWAIASVRISASLSTAVGEVGAAISALAVNTGRTLVEAVDVFANAAMGWNAVTEAVTSFSNLSTQAARAAASMCANGMSKAATAASATRAVVTTASKVMTVSIVLTVVAVLICVIFFAIDLVDYYNPEFSECPAVVLSEETLADGDTGYVTYYSVNYGTGSGPADTNGREGKDYTVSLFGSSAPYDLNTNSFTHNHGVYMYFDRVDENTLASVFTTPNIIIMCAAAVVIAGAVTATLVLKKKRKAAAEASDNTTESL